MLQVHLPCKLETKLFRMSINLWKVTKTCFFGDKYCHSNQIIYKDSFYCQSIVSAIRVIYTKSGEFYYKYLHRFSTISLIIGISGLSFVTASGNPYTKSISITYKSFYKQIIYFGLPGVFDRFCSRILFSRQATQPERLHKGAAKGLQAL